MLPETTSNDPSVVFITMHKAGSVIANEILASLLGPEGLVHVNFATNAFDLGVREQPYCAERVHLLRTPGYYFGAFRQTTSDWFGDLSSNRLIFQIRDPRDCIVSLYFSYRYSHPEPGNGSVTPLFDSLRKEARQSNIDEYAIKKIDEYLKRFRIINSLMDKFQNHILVRYEDMVLCFRQWLSDISDFLGVNPSQETLGALMKLANFDVAKEDVNLHKRQVTPGDFSRKLAPETQKKLTEAFSCYLEKFRYNAK